MRALLPLIEDTWRQSRQQVVFLIMLGLIGLTVLGGVILAQPTTATNEQGELVERVGLLGLDEHGDMLVQSWVSLHAEAITADYREDGEGPDPFSEAGQQLQQELRDLALAEVETAPKRKCVEVIIYGIAWVIYAITMLLFIAASAGYFPAMLETGAIDMVLAKPIDRKTVFFGKFVGGLALLAAALTAAYLLLFVGLGVRTGVWHPAVFRVMPLQLLSAATLFALIALVGVARRSTGLAMISGYAYYLIVDKLLRGLMMASVISPGWKRAQTIVRATLPNFAETRADALQSIIHAPTLDLQPIALMVVWLGLGLGLGYWLFARRDY